MNESNSSIELEDQPVDININPKPEPKCNKRVSFSEFKLILNTNIFNIFLFYILICLFFQTVHYNFLSSQCSFPSLLKYSSKPCLMYCAAPFGSCFPSVLNEAEVEVSAADGSLQ